jgi:hypothetical protein
MGTRRACRKGNRKPNNTPSTPIKHDPMFHRRNDHRPLFRRAEEVNQAFGHRVAIREHSFIVKSGLLRKRRIVRWSTHRHSAAMTVTWHGAAIMAPTVASIYTVPKPTAVAWPRVLIFATAWLLVFQSVTELP